MPKVTRLEYPCMEPESLIDVTCVTVEKKERHYRDLKEVEHENHRSH